MPVEESKSISAEIAELFSEIQGQAKEYAALMEELRLQAHEAQQQHGKLLNDAQKLKTAADTAISSVEQGAKDTLTSIQQKSAELQAMYDDLYTIKTLKSEVIGLQRTLQKRNDEIQHFLQTADGLLHKKVQEQYQEFEKLVKNIVKDLKQDIMYLSVHVDKTADAQNRNLNFLQTSFEEFKMRIGEIKLVVSNGNQFNEDIKKHVVHIIQEEIAPLRQQLRLNSCDDKTKLPDKTKLSEKEQIEPKESLNSPPVQKPPPAQVSDSEELIIEIVALRKQTAELKNIIRKTDDKIASARTAGVTMGIIAIIVALLISLLLRGKKDSPFVNLRKQQYKKTLIFSKKAFN